MALGNAVLLGKTPVYARLTQGNVFTKLTLRRALPLESERPLERRVSGAAGVDSNAQSELFWHVRVVNASMLQCC